ncbi:MAG: hypothetical protein AB7D37_07650 [Desulfovibrio sp.]
MTPDVLEISECIKELFGSRFQERCICLLGYGSAFNERYDLSSDIDLFVVLDTAAQGDMDLLGLISSNSRPLLDISLAYKSELPLSNPELFCDGSKTCLALAYLSSATVLLGNNIFKSMFTALSDEQLKVSILISVSRYISKMRNERLNYSKQGLSYVKKYLARVLIDVMIYYCRSDMSPYKKLKFNEVVRMAQKIPQLTYFLDDIQKITLSMDFDVALNIMLAVYSRILHDFRRQYS